MKKLYKKPEIKKVKLNPEEAVLAGCKTSATGPSQTTWCKAFGPSRCVTSAQGT